MIPADSMTRVAVFLTAELADTGTGAFPPYVGSFTQEIAERASALLGVRPDSLARGEPLLTWTALDQPVDLTAWRDGRFDWRMESDTGDTSGSAFIARALRAARDAGARLLWPDRGPDSVDVILRLRAPTIGRTGVTDPMRDSIAVPVFTVAEPREEPIRVVSERPPAYPGSAEVARAEGRVLLTFTVDTSGKPVESTIHEEWPRNRPRQTGRLGVFYEQFVRAAMEALPHWRLTPPRLGGCPFPRRVAQPFIFRSRG